MNLIVAILALITAVAYLAARISDAIDRRIESASHDHDHEMIGGSPL